MSKEYDKKILTAFMADLVYCLIDSDGNINLVDEDADFFADAFMESTDYEDFKKINEKK